METDERMQVVQQLCKVHGVGAVIANEWYTRGIRTIEEALGAGLMNEQQQIGARRRDPALFPSPSTPTSPYPLSPPPSALPLSPPPSPLTPLPTSPLTPSHLPSPTALDTHGCRHYEDLQVRIPREEVTAIAAAVRAALDRVLIAEGYPDDPGKLHAVAEAAPRGSN